MSDKNALAFAIVVGALLISSAMFYLGFSINKNRSGNTAIAPNNNTAVQNDNTFEAAPPERPQASSTVSIDDDPILGSTDAKVAIVEFSDFGCPFCARHAVETTPQIKADFIESGQVMLVYRDTPFKGTTSIQKANAANCVREQLGDEAYFDVKAEMYRVLNEERRNIEVPEIRDYAVSSLGINPGEFDSCVDEGRYNDEITKDLTDSQSYGITGTPSFVVGVVNENGEVEGEVISGAQPYAIFKATIEKYLN